MKNVDKMFKVFSILSIVLIVGVVCFSSINIGTRLGKYEAITDDAEFVRCYLGLMESEVISDLHIWPYADVYRIEYVVRMGDSQYKHNMEANTYEKLAWTFLQIHCPR